MDEKLAVPFFGQENGRTTETLTDGTTPKLDTLSQERKDETDSYLLAVDRAIQACAKLQSRSDQHGVKIFLNRNLFYLQPNETSKRKKKVEVRNAVKAYVPRNGDSAASSIGHRFPLLVTTSSLTDSCASTSASDSQQVGDARVKLQFVGFYDSESQEMWTTTSASMRVDLLVDLRNVRKNSTHRYVKPLFETPTQLQVNESDSDLAKRNLDNVVVDFGEIFDHIRRRFGPVRIDTIRLNIQVLVTEIRRARREFLTTVNKQNEASSHRHYPAKYAAMHVIWQRHRDVMNKPTSFGNSAFLRRSSAFVDSESDSNCFSLSSRFGEYEQRLRVVRVGNRSSDCTFNEPRETADDTTISEDPFELQSAVDSVQGVKKRLLDVAVGVQNGESTQSTLTNGVGGGHTKVNGVKSKRLGGSVSMEAIEDGLTTLVDAHCLDLDETVNDAASLSLVKPTQGRMRGPFIDELHQSPVLRFRIVPTNVTDSGDCSLRPDASVITATTVTETDQLSLLQLQQEQGRKSGPSSTSHEIITIRHRTAKRRMPSDEIDATESRFRAATKSKTKTKAKEIVLESSSSSRRPKRSAALDAVSLIRIRDSTLDNAAKRTKYQASDVEFQEETSDADSRSNRSRKRVSRSKAAKNGNGNSRNGHGNGKDATSGTPAYTSADSDSEEEARDTKRKLNRRKPPVKNRTVARSKRTVADSTTSESSEEEEEGDQKCNQLLNDATKFVRYVFADSDGVGVWRIVAVPDSQCLFCSLRALSFQALVVHLSYVHLQFHVEADLEVRCIGIRPKSRGEPVGQLLSDLRELGYQSYVHLPAASERLASIRQASQLLVGEGRAASIMKSKKTVLTVANSIGLFFSRCYSNMGVYRPQRRAEETYVIVIGCNRLIRQRLILDALSAKALLLEPLRSTIDCPSRLPYSRPGLDRVFFHTLSYLPVLPTELDDDSETENDSSWLHTRIATLLDDVIDVNEGEKQVMTIWCSHLLRHTYEFVGDKKVLRAVDTFIDENALALNLLRKNFVLLLASLCDYGVLNSADVRAAIRRLDERVQLESATATATLPSASNHCA